MLRRLHDKGLTSRPDTGLRSQLRSKYAVISKSKKYFGPLPSLKVSKYSPIENVDYMEYENSEYIEYGNIEHESIITEYDQEVINDIEERKNIRERKQIVKNTMDSINNKKPQVIPKPAEKKPMVINYEKVNKLLKNRIIPKSTPKIKEDNNQIITNGEIAKSVFPGKKNRRNGDPIMNIGGKFNS